ncbi:MAG: CAP domain-containing protein, partial [Halobacteriaceae archaeon]
CGWTTGLPGVRWFTKSVPAIQLRRTIVGPKLLVVVVALGLVVSGATAGVGVGELTENFTGTSTVDEGVQTPTRQWEHGYNRTQVQQHFINLLNQERRERGLGTVEAWDVLREMGRAHSQNMAVHDYIGHDEPEDGSIKQRFRAKGLLPECAIPIQGTDQYYPGAENAAKT